jgi:hypothetical protein
VVQATERQFEKSGRRLLERNVSGSLGIAGVEGHPDHDHPG